MNATKAKELLLPIPKEDFIAELFTDGSAKCCGIGHLQRLTSGNPNDYSTKNCSDHVDKAPPSPIRELTKVFMKKQYNIKAGFENINNEPTINGYTEDNPKDRVMHLLDDMIKAGY